MNTEWEQARRCPWLLPVSPWLAGASRAFCRSHAGRAETRQTGWGSRMLWREGPSPTPAAAALENISRGSSQDFCRSYAHRKPGQCSLACATAYCQLHPSLGFSSSLSNPSWPCREGPPSAFCFCPLERHGAPLGGRRPCLAGDGSYRSLTWQRVMLHSQRALPRDFSHPPRASGVLRSCTHRW